MQELFFSLQIFSVIGLERILFQMPTHAEPAASEKPKYIRLNHYLRVSIGKSHVSIMSKSLFLNLEENTTNFWRLSTTCCMEKIPSQTLSVLQYRTVFGDDILGSLVLLT